MADPAERRTRWLTLAAFAALAFAYAYLLQPAWDNERAHYDLTRALAQGSPSIDDNLRHPALRTIDVTRHQGHYYAAKMPGFAAANLPPYIALRAAGADTTSHPRRMAWALHLWSVVLPAIVLLVLVRRRADRLVAGFGTIAAVSLGTATLVLPFSSVFFSHVLSALLGFGAFALLARERGSPSLPIAAAAGFLAGLACTVEYSLVIVAAALGVLILTGTNRIQRALAYSAAVALGVLPAFLFNTWAFGTPLHFPYEGWHRVGEKPLPGVFGITTPTLHNLLKILFYPGGIGPLLLAGVVGAVLLWRKGLRTEAALPVLVAAAFILADAASSTPFGGVSPGPRYVIPALPFLALPLAAAYRAFPGATLGLMIGGGTFMVAATMTTALEAWDGLVAHRLATGDFVDSVASFVGLESSATAVPFALAVAVAAAAAVAATPWPKTTRREIVAGVAALAGWLLISTHMTDLLKRGLPGELIALASFVVATAIVVASYRASAPTRPRPMRSSES